MNKDKYLPIGSIVRLKGGDNKLMITSYLIIPNKKSDDKSLELFDYGSCVYPVGLLDSKQAVGFNHDAIEEVIYIGYKDDEYNKLNAGLNASAAKIKEELKKSINS